jgi:fused signal recognition particle receptor
VWIVVGVNGVGKTTTIGKLAKMYNDKKVILGAADTFRAAASEQLSTWAKLSNVQIVKETEKQKDPASIAFESVKFAKDNLCDLVIIDTAGRFENKKNLMQELSKVKRVVEKTATVAEVLLVIDATTGQSVFSQAKEFLETVSVTGIVLTKLDGTAKGGAVFRVQSELGIPVKFMGFGEGIDDLKAFEPETFVEGLLS